MRFAFPVFNLNIFVNSKQNPGADPPHLREEFQEPQNEQYIGNCGQELEEEVHDI